MTRQTRAVGTHWEDFAARMLEAEGLSILARQYRCRLGEIDLIAADGATVVFVEVRFRATAEFGGAAASVTRSKQRRIVSAARHFIMHHGELAERPMRMDIVAIDGSSEQHARAASVRWIRGAFEPE